MAAYVKQGDQIVLLLSRAEAQALRDLALYAEHALADDVINKQTKLAADRASRALSIACEPSSRSGAAIQ